MFLSNGKQSFLKPSLEGPRALRKPLTTKLGLREVVNILTFTHVCLTALQTSVVEKKERSLGETLM